MTKTKYATAEERKAAHVKQYEAEVDAINASKALSNLDQAIAPGAALAAARCARCPTIIVWYPYSFLVELEHRGWRWHETHGWHCPEHRVTN